MGARAGPLAEQDRPRMNGKDPAGRVAEIARIQDENGYLAEWEQLDDCTFQLQEHNCPILQVAQCYRQACVCELAMFQDLLGAEVVREKHILNGDESCVYRIRSKT